MLVIYYIPLYPYSHYRYYSCLNLHCQFMKSPFKTIKIHEQSMKIAKNISSFLVLLDNFDCFSWSQILPIFAQQCQPWINKPWSSNQEGTPQIDIHTHTIYIYVILQWYPTLNSLGGINPGHSPYLSHIYPIFSIHTMDNLVWDKSYTIHIIWDRYGINTYNVIQYPG